MCSLIVHVNLNSFKFSFKLLHNSMWILFLSSFHKNKIFFFILVFHFIVFCNFLHISFIICTIFVIQENELRLKRFSSPSFLSFTYSFIVVYVFIFEQNFDFIIHDFVILFSFSFIVSIKVSWKEIMRFIVVFIILLFMFCYYGRS